MMAKKQNPQAHGPAANHAPQRALAISSAIAVIGFAAFGLFLALFLGSEDLQWMTAFLLLAMAGLAVAWTALRALLQAWRRAAHRNLCPEASIRGAVQVRDG